MTFSRFLPLLVLAATGNLASAFVVPSNSATVKSISSSSSSSQLQALSFMENFRQDAVNRRDPYRQEYQQGGDYYNDYNRKYYGSGLDQKRNEHRNRMYSPRNDVYQRRTEVVNGRPTYNDNYRPMRSLVNPRNDVYAPRQVDYSMGNPRQVDYAADSMVDRELAKIRAKGRYAIENELYNTYGLSFSQDLTHEELACHLLRARLRYQDGQNSNQQRGNWYSSNQRVRYNNNKSNTAGSWVDGSSNMWSDNFWRN